MRGLRLVLFLVPSLGCVHIKVPDSINMLRTKSFCWGILLVLALLPNAQGQGPGNRPPELVAPTEANTPAEERARFRLPPGFEAQLVACEPDIAKPMNLAFDDMGRLWVTSSYEYPWPVEADKPCRDKVTILSDFAPDGRARKVTTFAEGLNIPIGVLPLSPRDAFVHSIPNIYH